MFHDVEFPLSLDRCVSTCRQSTTKIEVGNFNFVRIANWGDGQVQFNATPGVRSLKDLRTLLSFHRRRKGPVYSFRVRDLVDYEAEPGDEGTFATGDGTAGPFQLTKTYTDDANSDVRKITKPEQGTVKIYVNGVLKTEGGHYTLDYLTGKVLFTAGNFPAVGAVLEWEGRFFVCVMFVDDEIPVGEFLATMEDDGSGEYVVGDGSAEISPVLMVEVDE